MGKNKVQGDVGHCSGGDQLVTAGIRAHVAGMLSQGDWVQRGSSK